VEDETAILNLGRAVLAGLGYTVLAAGTPAEAVALARTANDIHLLITDVVMPGMNGRELAERLAPTRPGLKHLFMSGYTADVIAHRGILNEGVQFIQKPFSRRVLALKVRETLDQP
jgi:CheY-like chemotaxis protein